MLTPEREKEVRMLLNPEVCDYDPDDTHIEDLFMNETSKEYCQFCANTGKTRDLLLRKAACKHCSVETK